MILPSPTTSFEWVGIDGVPGLVCRPLEPFAPHLFTTRHWRLGSRTLESDDTERWNEVAAALEVDERRLVRVRQVHGAEMAIARGGVAIRQDADIIVSDDPAFALAIRVADCVPLLIADRRTGAVAAAHAGWRGLAGRVPAAAVDALARECGSRVEDLVAAAGPSIGACCYEVGPDVREGFTLAGFSRKELDEWFVNAPVPTSRNPSMPGLEAKGRPGRWFFDGWACTRGQLIAAGVRSAQIFLAEICTASHPGALCSYRRDGAPAGRLAGAIKSVRRRP